ncbi:MAG: C40 family peptidase [Actinomyces graevenitzii]|nr:C40 family peptidase [Actinomyces graevenitzii]
MVLSANPVAFADGPSQDDINKSKQKEASTSASIASLEARLATLKANTENATMKAQIATEDYLQSLDALNKAKAATAAARAKATAATKQTHQARKSLSDVVVQTYQDGGNPFDIVSPYLTGRSLGDIASQKAALDRAGENTDAKLQKVQALQSVATTMEGIAAQKESAQRTATQKTEATKNAAQAAANAAQAAQSQATSQRANLISQLAAQRNTTVALETQRQEQLEQAEQNRKNEEARKQAQQAAAQAKAKEEQEKQNEAKAKETASPTPSQPDPQPSQTAAPEPAPSQTTTPEPAPSPSETSQPAPAPEPEPEPAPAPTPEPDPEPEPDPTPAPSGGADVAIAKAYTFIGVDYVWGGESYSGVDCSGLAMLSWAAAGVSLTHSSRAQYWEGTHVSLDSVQPGDLIFWSSDGSAGSIYHVAIYLGNDQMIEAPTFGVPVRVTGVRYSGIMPYAVRL